MLEDEIVTKRHLQRTFSTLWTLLHFFVTFFFLELTHLLPLIIGDTTRADVDQGGEEGRSDFSPIKEVRSTVTVDSWC